MHRALRTLALAAFAASLAVAGGAVAAWALSPDDAIYLTEQGVDDDVIIAKICADGEAWDLSAEDISYLADQGVDDNVVEALIDPAGAADRYGFRLGDGDRYSNEPEHTPYVFSSGYYYGPIARAYFYDPFFYSYMYCDQFSFSFSSWPSYYAGYCWPYSYGFYAYPYFGCARSSFYNGFAFCGPSYRDYRTRYRDGFGNGGGNVRWRDWNGSGNLSSRSPDNGDHRKMLNVGGDVERRVRAGDGVAQAPSVSSRGNGNGGNGRWQRNDLGRVADRESRSGVERRGNWTPRVVNGNGREISGSSGRSWGRPRDVVDRPNRQSVRRYEPAPREGARVPVYRFPSRGREAQGEARGESRQQFRTPSRSSEPQAQPQPQPQPRVERGGHELRVPERGRDTQGESRGQGRSWLPRAEGRGNGEEHKR